MEPPYLGGFVLSDSKEASIDEPKLPDSESEYITDGDNTSLPMAPEANLSKVNSPDEQPEETPQVGTKVQDVITKIGPDGSKAMRKVEYLSGKAPPLSSVVGAKPKIKAQEGFSWLNDTAVSSNVQDYRIEVIRIQPKVDSDHLPLHTGVVLTYDYAVEFPYIESALAQSNGGGTYRVNVFSKENNKIVANPKFTINNLPPLRNEVDDQVPAFSGYSNQGVQQMYTGHGSATYPPNRRGGHFSQVPIVPDSVQRVNEERMVAEAETGKVKAKMQGLKAEKEFEKLTNSDKYEKEAVARIKIEKEEKDEKERQRLETDQRRRDDDRKREDKKWELAQASSGQNAMMAIMASLFQKQSQPPQVVPDTTTPIMIESMKAMSMQQQESTKMMMTMMTQSSQQTIAMMTAMMTALKPDDGKSMEMFKFMLDSSNTSNTRFDKLINTVLVNKVGGSENQFDQVAKIISLAKELIPGGESDDELDYDQDAGLLGNFGKLAFNGIKSLVSGGLSGKGADLIGAMNTMFQKPAGNEQFSDTELQQVNSAIGQVDDTDFLRKTIVANAPLGVEVMHQPPIPVGVPTRMAVPVQTLSQPIQEVGVVEVQRPNVQAVAQVVVEAVPISNEGAILRLKEVVTESVRIMLENIKDGVNKHNWIDFAFDNWPKPFLHTFCNTVGDEDLIEHIQDKCDAESFTEFYQLILNGDSSNFVKWLDAVKLLKAQAGVKVATTPTTAPAASAAG